MKAGWESKKLGAFAALVSTGPFGSVLHKSDYVDKGVPLVNPINLVGERIVPDPTKLIDKLTTKRLNNYVLQEGDIVVGRRGEIGRCAVVGADESGWVCGTGSFFIRPLPTTNSQFLAHLIRSDSYREKLEHASTGATMKNMSNSTLSDLIVAIPPLPEQQRIVTLLDEAFDGIATAKANAEKNLLNARALFKSYRQSVLSQRGEVWLDKSLGELCDIKHGFAFKSEFFVESGRHVLLTPGNFYESGGYRDRGEKQKYYAAGIPKGFVLAEGDLLVAMTEQAAGLLGSPILVPESGKFLHNQRLGLVTPKSGVAWANEYFFHVFNTEAVRHAIHASATGVKVRHTSPTKIGEVKVSFPSSVSEQLELVGRLLEFEQETQRLESIYQQKLAALDELKKSLLHQAFSGAL
ncbi:MAG: restriction endonuclease subunit S [Polaromonas sp.]|uniref:restriction endonuclease subunit S n=1 Tax=Polaromonas sp. TaxID=1869339 RepID=UPI0024873EBD|nr:restriction endonuclease subunit S [Polaromonas sp.]MDI1269960.1 restriction endonuclease subunit S [Polaromonas sp.]